MLFRLRVEVYYVEDHSIIYLHINLLFISFVEGIGELKVLASARHRSGPLLGVAWGRVRVKWMNIEVLSIIEDLIIRLHCNLLVPSATASIY